MSREDSVRRIKSDPADGRDTSETYLPGQIPVNQTTPADDFARATEQQPDAAEAAKAVNPRDLADVEPEDKGSGE